jgi:hypothetical protein
MGKGGTMTNYAVRMTYDFLSKRDYRRFGKVCLPLACELFQSVICADKCETPFKANGNVVVPFLIKARFNEDVWVAGYIRVAPHIFNVGNRWRCVVSIAA